MIYLLVRDLKNELDDVAISGLVVNVPDHIPVRDSECSPTLDAAHALLQRLKNAYETGRKQNRKNGFTVPVNGVRLADNPARKKDQKISKIVGQLHDAGFSKVAVYWQSLTDGPSHFRVASLQIDAALERLTRSFDNTLDSDPANE